MAARTLELLLATAIGAVSVAVVTTTLGEPAVEHCQWNASESTVATLPSPLPTPSRVQTRPNRWDVVETLGLVAVAPPQDMALGPDGESTVQLTLTPDPHACSDLLEGKCAAGCFEIMAIGEQTGPVEIDVLALDEPTTPLATDTGGEGTASAGFCYSFLLGHSGRRDVRVRVRASGTQSGLQVAAWRHPRTDDSDTFPSQVDLRMPAPGTARSEVFARVPECAETWWPEEQTCQAFGSLQLPASEICRDGCTRWTFTFQDEALVSTELIRSVADSDDEYAGRFADEAMLVARQLERRIGPPNVDNANAWRDVEAPEHGVHEALTMQRRTWAAGGVATSWELRGVPGHHPVVELRVLMNAAP